MTHQDYRIYLYARKWRLRRVTSTQLVFEKRLPGGLVGIEIPSDYKSPDYHSRLRGVLTDLSAVECRPAPVIEAEVVKFSAPALIDNLLYLLFVLIVLAFCLYSWVLLWYT